MATRQVIKTQAVTVPQQSTEALIAQAIEKGVPVETMERLLAMRRELKAEFAKEQFDHAMAKFQGECPVIVKTKEGGKTKSGLVAYRYAPLDIILAQTKEMIQRNGFSYAIQTSAGDNKVKVTCIVKHMSGHSESSDIEVPLGTKTDIMSAPQVVAAALTFAERYAFCNAVGILTGDADTDAKGSGKKGTGDKLPEPELFAQAMSMIQKSKNAGGLIELSEKLKASKTYTKEHQAELQRAISQRVDFLSNEKAK